ncbi:MAG: pyrroline-5-carboxylate reductase family protein [Micromonosporaceae bacterium]
MAVRPKSRRDTVATPANRQRFNKMQYVLTKGSTMKDAAVGLIGAGQLARALARGWSRPIVCTDAGSGRAAALAAEMGGTTAPDNRTLAAAVDVVVLCHKPAQLATVAGEIDGTARLVVSVLSGITQGQLGEAYRRSPVVRVAANLAVEVRRGVVCLPATAEPDRHYDSVAELFADLGMVVRVAEDRFPAVIATSGVGPAYYALFAEAQVDAAIRAGLPQDLAARLVTETMRGAAELLASRGHDTLSLRRAVASPAGPTARGLAELEAHGLRRAVLAATESVMSGGRPTT